MSRCWVKSSACRLQSTLSCAVLCHMVSLHVFVQVVSPPLGWSPLSSFLVIWSPSDDKQGPSVVFDAVDMPCPGPFHFSHSVDYIYDFCPLPDTDVGLSILVCDYEHTSFHFGLCGRKFVLCLLGRLLLKMSWCLAYAAQPAMILRCISLSWFFSLRL